MNLTQAPRECPCGSGRTSEWLYDARGIPCCRICPACEREQRTRYRADIFTNPSYQADEPIEPDNY